MLTFMRRGNKLSIFYHHLFAFLECGVDTMETVVLVAERVVDKSGVHLESVRKHASAACEEPRTSLLNTVLHHGKSNQGHTAGHKL